MSQSHTMLVEQRIYTLHPGKAAEWIKIYEAEGMQHQVPAQGRMIGYFTTEFGGLNQVIHMWGYASVEDRLARRGALFANAAWNAFLAKVRPFLITMENKLLIPAPWSPVGGARPVKSPVDGAKHGFVEERVYTLQAGTIGHYMAAYEEFGMRVQVPTLGSMVGWYTTEFGPLNQIVHQWSYESLAERARRRAEMQANPDWQAYAGRVRAMAMRQENKLLLPAPFSPIGGARPVQNPTA
jgi:hypothetical protein